MAKQKIKTFLWFDSNAEQAVKFYISVFKKGSKILAISKYGEGTPKPKGSVLTIEFQLAGQKFVALNGGPQFKFTEAISLLVDCSSQKEVDTLWRKLTADGGQEIECGWLKDKFGLCWQIVPTKLMKLIADKDAAKANRVMQAMMKMKKIDIAELEKAAAAKN